MGDIVYVDNSDENNKIYFNIYRLGDLVIINNMLPEHCDIILNDYPNSIASEFILEKKNKSINYYYGNPSKDIRNETIKIISNIAMKYANENINLIPEDINNSMVIHLRLGDVMGGKLWHEKERLPFDIDDLKIKINNDEIKKYIIGKCHYDYAVFNDYDECNKLSLDYLNKVIKEFNAIHLNTDNADLDLSCAIKCKIFVQGRGHYSQLIKLIRNYFNLETIECTSLISGDYVT
jgi:hypothetical protein